MHLTHHGLSMHVTTDHKKTFEVFGNLEGLVRSSTVAYRHLSKKAMDSTPAFHSNSTSANASGNSTSSQG